MANQLQETNLSTGTRGVVVRIAGARLLTQPNGWRPGVIAKGHSCRQRQRAHELIARKWLNLALRRLDYYNELYRSGRWKHYYSEEAMVLRMRDVMKAVHLWGELAAQARRRQRRPSSRGMKR